MMSKTGLWMVSPTIMKEKVFEGWCRVVEASRLLGWDEDMHRRTANSHEKVCLAMLRSQGEGGTQQLVHAIFSAWHLECIRLLRTKSNLDSPRSQVATPGKDS